jgi:hypothetical protein
MERLETACRQHCGADLADQIRDSAVAKSCACVRVRVEMLKSY